MKKKDANSKEEIERRKKKYGCSGKCYTTLSMCEKVEICPETRKGEWRATVVVMLLLFLALLAGIALLLWVIRAVVLFLLTGLLKVIGSMTL